MSYGDMVAATIRERLLTEGAAAWNKHLSVWRVAEDDPDSGLYDESGDVDLSCDTFDGPEH